MLRVVFIITLLIGFAGYALRGPVEALVLYLWLAYFRPESWAWTPVFMTLPLSMVAGVYLFLRVGLSSISFKVDRRVVVLFSFLVIALIATEQSRWYRLSQGLTGDISKAFLVTYLMALLCSTTERFRIILITISMSLGFEQAKQGWARLIFSPGSRNDNSIPMFGDNNGVAAVTDDEGHLVGLLTERQILRRVFLKALDPLAPPIPLRRCRPPTQRRLR